MAKRSESVIGAQQTSVMQHLTLTACAWLLGISPRSLRDQPDLPRGSDGRYNAAEAVRWTLGRVPRPELSDADCERVLQIGEYLDVLLTSEPAALTILDTLKDIRSRYGEFALIAFMDNLLEVLEQLAAEHRSPKQQEQPEAETARKRRQQDRAAEAELRITYQCERCHKIRRGRNWIKKKAPKDHVVALMFCPACQAET